MVSVKVLKAGLTLNGKPAAVGDVVEVSGGLVASLEADGYFAADPGDPEPAPPATRKSRTADKVANPQ